MNIKKISLMLGSLVFFVFAYLQFSDSSQYENSNTLAWIVIYVVAALLSLSCAYGEVSSSVLYLWTGFLLGALVFKLQDDQGNFHFDRLDLATLLNEAGSLLILLIWAILLLILNRPKRSSHYIS